MAKYKLVEMTDLRNTGKRRVYPKLVTNRTMSFSDLLDKMKLHNHAMSSSTVEAAVTDVRDMLVELLSMGYNVNIEGLGVFSLSLGFEDDKPTEMQGDDDKMIYRKVGVKNVNFKPAPELVKDIKIETDRDLERDMGGVKVIRKELYTQEQRIARALKVIDDRGFICLTDYAYINNLSRTAASLELKEICAKEDSPIRSVGQHSHKVWVKRLLVCLMVMLGLFGNMDCTVYAQQKHKQRRTAEQKMVAKTDMQLIRGYVKERFALWCNKDEFEKAIAVGDRLQKHSKGAFDEICMTAVNARIYQLKIESDSWLRSISAYDSEKETFAITMMLNGLKINRTISVPIDKAPRLKADFKSLPMYFGKEWCEVAGKLYPKTVKIVDDAIDFSTVISLTYKNAKPITIAFDGLGIDNAYLKGYRFNYDKALQDSSLAVGGVKTLLPGPYQPSYGDKVFDVVEEMPRFPGGTSALMAFLKSQVQYPADAKAQGLKGRVIVGFVVEKDGSLSQVKVMRSVDKSLDKEAMRVVNSMPRWVPGMQNGQVVRTKYTVAVAFK